MDTKPADASALSRPSPQAASNASVWAQGRHLAAYANDVLSPVEVQIFIRYHEKLSGRVLDVGCGAGRVLTYLLMIGAETHGIDLAPNMVGYCRRALPRADVRVGDARALKASVEGPFDVVFALNNLIDVFDDGERRQVIASIRELLEPDGLFIFSTHDLGWMESNPTGPKPGHRGLTDAFHELLDVSPGKVLRAVRNRREIAANRRRLGPLQAHTADYEIINDSPHNYSLLHYYIRRDDQVRQLRELGFALVECLSGDGSTVGPGASGTRDFLHYVARVAD